MTEDVVAQTNAWDRALALCGVQPDQADETINRFPYEPIDALEIRLDVTAFFDRLFMHFAEYVWDGEIDPVLLSLARCLVDKALSNSQEYHEAARKFTNGIR
jgi:hypothetical protein